MLPLQNAIPLLGKDLSPYLIAKLIKHRTKIILCLDEDALDDMLKMYYELSSYNLDVYIVEIKDDIAKFYERYGRKKLIELLGTYRKPSFSYIFNLKLNLNKKSKRKNKMNPEQLTRELLEYKKQTGEYTSPYIDNKDD
jgi:DNA primase